MDLRARHQAGTSAVSVQKKRFRQSSSRCNHVHDRRSEDVAEWNTAGLSQMVSTTLKSTQRAIADQEQEFFREAERLRREIAVAADKAKKPGTGNTLQQTFAKEISLSLTQATADVKRRARCPRSSRDDGHRSGGHEHPRVSWRFRTRSRWAWPSWRHCWAATSLDGHRRRTSGGSERHRDLLDGTLTGEISSIHGEVTSILSEHKKGEANADRAVVQLRKLERENLEIEQKLDELLFEAGLAR